MAMQDQSQSMSRDAIRAQFTTPKKELANHNPKQPWLGLPSGSHTHAAARGAVHDVHGVGPGMTYTGMARSMPQPEKAPHAVANERDVRAAVKHDEDSVEVTNAPKG